MSASSLIFLLIVAIWAAYLLQHWVRRREHLATARSVDRFSEAMRVLERRDPLPESPMDAAERRSYSVGPARPSRPSVTVKRAAATTDGPVPHPDRSRPADPEGPGRLARVGRAAGRVSGRRLRGVSLLSAVTALLTLAVLVPVLGLPRWALGIAGGVVVADLAWLRIAARRSAPRAHTTPARRPAPSADLGTSRATSGLSGRTSDVRAADPRSSSEVAPPAEVVVYDDLAPAVEACAPAPEPAEDDAAAGALVDPHAWQPVPVPPPTYTLKAKAERPAPSPAEAPAAGAEVGDDPVFDGTAAEPGAGPVDYSRVPTGELPFDGYALDEDLEELPAVYQAV